MIKNLCKRGLVLGIIVLFIGACVIPSTVGIIKEKIIFNHPTSRGYIQDLIDNASPGDTIYIPSGIYYENIIINKSISLIGEDKDTTIFDGGGIGDVVYVSADGVKINFFTIQNSGQWSFAGINLFSNYNMIIDNIVYNNNYNGIGLSHSKYNTIQGNTINSNNYYGIDLISSNDNIIIGNTISSNKYNGIGLSQSNGNTFIGNNISSNKDYGIYLEYSSSNEITENNISSNKWDGINLEGSNHNIISNNIINSSIGDGIYVEYSISNTISNNTISDSWYDGIGLLFNSKNNIIKGNNIKLNDKCGIHLWHSSNRNNISENNITSNNEDGIEILASDYNTIIDNVISNNGYGINIHCNFMGDDFSNNNNIIGNTINSNKRDGICLHNRETSSDNNIITGNAFSLNNGKSINFSCSGDNIVSKNNLLGFKNHVFFKDCENTWEQNYWYRPRILPKLIFGKNTIGYKILPWINIDWLPALKPYKIRE